MSGLLVLGIDGAVWEITRTTTKLSLSIDGTAVVGMKAEIQDRINTALGGNLEVFEALSYKRQMDLGKFFYTEDSKLKSFFSQCIPELDKLEIIATEATKKANILQQELKAQQSVYPVVLSQLNSFADIKEESLVKLNDDLRNAENLLASLRNTDPQPNPDDSILFAAMEIELNEKQSEFDRIKSDSATLDPIAQAKMASLESELETAQKELESISQSSPVAAVDSQIAILEKSLEDVGVRERSISQKNNNLNSCIERIKALNSAIEHLSQDKCPTCLRSWAESQKKFDVAKTERNGLMVQALELEKEIKSTPDLSLLRREIGDNILTLRAQRDQIHSQISSVRNRIAVLNSQKKNIISSHDDLRNQKIKTITSEITSKQLAIRELKSKAENDKTVRVMSATHSVSRIKSDISNLKNMLSKKAELELSIKACEGKTSQLKSDYDLESNIAKIVGRNGVLGLFFDELIKEIEVEANQILSSIPNTSDITVSISSVQQTQSGTSKAKISTQIVKSGHDISFRSLSGGQRASLSLAVDLAMMSSIKRRTNVYPAWIALDESLDGMDVASKELAIAAIRAHSQNSLVLMIDHATEIKELFDRVITVGYDGVSSRVTCD
jgi:DNA repair exonuclease SbcCD ATPase subunit